VNLIDGIYESCQWHTASGSGSEGKWMKTLDLQTVALAGFREVPVDVQESISIFWTRDRKPLDGFTKKTTVILDDEDVVGRYIVDMKFTTKEVRADSAGLLTAKTEYFVKSKCRSLIASCDY
jgi:hypothetical protein